jgi:hypothetical protein
VSIHPRSWRKKVLASVTALGSASIAAALLVSGLVSASAQSTTNGATLAQEYLAALKPAGAAINSAETQLARLPVTATLAQVKTIVGSLPKALAPLEALAAVSSAPSLSGTSLQALGKPAISGQGGVTCNGYGTSASGAHLVVGSIQYKNGFQMSAPATCIENYAGYTWHIPSRYTTLKAEIGYDLSNACAGSIVRFLGSQGEFLPFTSGEKIMEGMEIPATGLASVSVEVTHQSALTVQITFTNACGTNTSVIDVVNDQLLT